MHFKTFLTSIIKNIIILLVATLIFSSITLDLPDLLKGVFGDIFAYADTDAQRQVVSKLTETCSSLDVGQNLLHDLSNIGALCKDYKSGKINDKEFFFSVISDSIPSNIAMSNIGALEKYNQAVNYLNNNKILYFVVLAVLMIILYLLITDIKSFLIALTGISFSIGILIMLPYFAIISYDKFVGIDTTPILGSIFGTGNVFEPKAIISVILLLFLRTYNSLIITLGFVFFAVGVIGKIYGIVLKRKLKIKAEVKEEHIKEAPKKKKKVRNMNKY